MKIVMLDYKTLNVGDLSFEELKALGDVELYENTDIENENEIIERIGDAKAIIVNKTPISKNVIERCKNLKYIGLCSTGYNNIDIEAANERGISVRNCPDYSTYAVSQFTIGLLLEICHNTYRHTQSVMSGDWIDAEDFCYWKYPVIELYGKTMGIIGFGDIGKNTGRIAKSLGMNVIATGSRPTKEGMDIGRYVPLDKLLRESDVTALHCPLNRDTERIINRETISKMKDGVILLNTARGGLIDEEDFRDALNSGKIYAAGIDTIAEEPMREDNVLLGAKNLLITPHIAWSSVDTRKRLLKMVVDNLNAYMKGESINEVK